MRFVGRLVVLAIVCCLFGLGAGAALAADLKSEVASCFPAAPAGYEAEEEVYFDTELGKGLLAYLQRGDEVSRDYKGEQDIGIHLMGKGIGSFINAANGELPGCKALKVDGRKATVFYDGALIVIVADKVAVEISFDNGWAGSKDVVLPLAKKFDYDKLESLLK